ncbi:hypothetical protein [Halioxenophilus sp. WMMB6]|uniref:hypothetical protein n=1 Tax=Halioxenophilus sp. WMMB6 TaxID=3073815 RepID=UPI00295F1D87|nr:hypothetical protein [Halioxenophilus sp. WMMB6]
MRAIPDFYQKRLCGPGTATLSVLAKDGSIQSTLVWPDFDGTYLKLNMLAGSPKETNIRREGRATLLMADPADDNLYISLRCRLHKIERDHAIDHLNQITQRNMGVASWYGEVESADCPSQQRRVVVYLKPVHVYHT